MKRNPHNRYRFIRVVQLAFFGVSILSSMVIGFSAESGQEVTDLASPGKGKTTVVDHHGHQVESVDDTFTCIACHDGHIAGSVRVCTVSCDFRTPHSLFRSYPPEGKEELFAPEDEIKAKGILLAEGKVICQSCHDLRNPKKNHLALESQKSNLCMACHLVLKQRN